MKLMASMMVSVDGVYQGPGGPDEDRRNGFDRGGWTAAHADEEMWPYLVSMFERAVASWLPRLCMMHASMSVATSLGVPAPPSVLTRSGGGHGARASGTSTLRLTAVTGRCCRRWCSWLGCCSR